MTKGDDRKAEKNLLGITLWPMVALSSSKIIILFCDSRRWRARLFSKLIWEGWCPQEPKAEPLWWASFSRSKWFEKNCRSSVLPLPVGPPILISRGIGPSYSQERKKFLSRLCPPFKGYLWRPLSLNHSQVIWERSPPRKQKISASGCFLRYSIHWLIFFFF